LVYSRDALLNLAKSPLARLSPETRDSLRNNVPEIMTNRKQRKAIEYRNHIQHQAENKAQRTQTQNVARDVTQTVNVVRAPVIAPARRARPTGHTPENRRKIATKVVDELSWRGRRPTIVTLTPIMA
jgi:hypothetical protein